MKHRVMFILASVVFFLGYVSFSFFHWRIGPHPTSLRVLGASRALGQTISECFSGNDGLRTKFMLCAEKKLMQSVQAWGMRSHMVALEERQLKDAQAGGQSITQCHDLSHAIGSAGLYDIRDLNTALISCTNTCVYGCQHGVISAWYSLGKDIVGQLPSICVEGIDWTKLPFGQNGCFHEVGHAMASIAGYDMEKSLRYCDQVDDIGRIDCAHGVFMEMYEPATFTLAPQPLPPNYVAWCGSLWAPYDKICYDKAGANIYGRTQDDDASYAICREVPLQYQGGCIRALGQNIFYVYQHDADQSQKVIAFCRKAGEYFNECLAGALSSSSVSQKNAIGAVRICQEFLQEERLICINGLREEMKASHTKEEQRVICSQFESSERSICEIDQ
jgi:hypothetical protein